MDVESAWILLLKFTEWFESIAELKCHCDSNETSSFFICFNGVQISRVAEAWFPAVRLPQWGTQQRFVRGTPYPFHGKSLSLFYHFIQKRDPSHIPSIEKWHSFTYFSSLLTSLNAPSLIFELITRPERFFKFFTAQSALLAFLGLFTEWSDRVPFSSICFNL